jgi:hypothetical protein
VGGFLGSGKTTLILAAARMLWSRGIRSAVVLNDQGIELVDTRLAREAGFDAQEVAGGCFCCRFSEFVASAERLLAAKPDVIFAEPVGSCTDLIATVLRPLGAHFSGRFRLAPFTVLVDPGHAVELLQPESDPLLAYLYRKQIEEADAVWFSKSETIGELPGVLGIEGKRLSSVTGEGVSEWLGYVLGTEREQGARLLDIDYHRYAEAEAHLGWVNWKAELTLHEALSPSQVAGPLLEGLDQAFSDAGIAIAHLKLFSAAATGFIKASICRNGEEPSVSGSFDASPALHHQIVINLRASGEPDVLAREIDRVTAELPGILAIRHFEAFRPSAPVPEYRFTGLATSSTQG